MLIAIFIANLAIVALLAVLVYFAFLVFMDEQFHAEPPAPVEVHHHTTEVRHVASPAPAAPPARSDLVQVLKKYAHGWDHHGWVQRDSDAHADALRRPAYAIKDGESIDHGVQD